MKRETLRRLIPPIVWNWLRLRRSDYRIETEWPILKHDGWEYAIRTAEKEYNDSVRCLIQGQPIGSKVSLDISHLNEADKLFQDTILQMALIVAKEALRQGYLRILDYGGGFGIHEIAIKRLFPYLQYDYTVCELKEVCERGQRINRRVKFVPSLACAGVGYNLVYASSSIQYLQDWKALIAELSSSALGSIFINRTPFVFGSNSFITIQKAYSTEYPGWVFNYNEVVSEFSKHKFELKEVILNAGRIPIPGIQRKTAHLGILFEKR